MVHIPIVYATADDDYVFIVIVSITSLALSASENTFYNIHILTDDGFDRENEMRMALEQYREKLSIEFIKVGNRFEKAHLRCDFIGRPTYFRLALLGLLPEEKCIYLDADTIICGDLQKLYKTDITDQYIAGVKAPWFHITEDGERYRKQAMLPSMKQYVNAGVLLMNLDEMRKHDLTDKFIDYLKYDMESQDQDIINSCCYGKITFLPFQYNVMTKYSGWSLENYKGCFSDAELVDAWNNPLIIHYADRTKPWNVPECCMGELWCEVCRKNNYAWAYFTQKHSLRFFLRTIFNVSSRHTNTMFANISNLPRLFNLSAKHNLALYGAGKRAAEFMEYLDANNIIPKLIIVKEKKGNPEEIKNVRVFQLNELEKLQSDTTLVIATRESLQEEIMQDIEEFRFRETFLLNDKWRYAL